MAGGIFTNQDKVRPGIYQNIKTTKLRNTNNAIESIVAIALPLNFGPENKIIEINNETDIQEKLGYNISDADLMLIREIMKATNKILIYRLNSGEKAKATIIDTATVEAKFSGTKGNEISLIIANNVEGEEKYDVMTYFEGIKVDTQTIANYEEFKENRYIKIIGTGSIENVNTLKLSNGTSEELADEVTQYTKFLEALELENYNYLAYTGTNDQVKALIVSYVKRMNDEEGIRVKAVMGEYAADYEKIISIKNGVILEDGTQLSKEQCAAYFAGLSSSSDINQSNTYAQYPNAIDVNPRLNNSDTIKALKAGNIVFTRKNDDTVIIEQDINSLVTYTVEKNSDFAKNRFIRAIDDLLSDIKSTFENTFIGKINNDADGRNILRASIIEKVKEKVERGAFQNFVEDDVVVSEGNYPDSVVVTVGIQGVDSIEKIYMNVEVQ